MTMVFVLRAAGASLIVLSLFHAILWRSLNWGPEIARLSPLNARVFVVHTFFITFVLAALGLLSLVKPELLLAPSELARLLLFAVVVFWVARLAIQFVVFDRVMRQGWTRSPIIRIGACIGWSLYVAVYGAALAVQLGAR
jgi:hypothetical protein